MVDNAAWGLSGGATEMPLSLRKCSVLYKAISVIIKKSNEKKKYCKSFVGLPAASDA